MNFVEHYKRSIAKTITYRLLILISTYLVIDHFVNNQGTSLKLTIITNIFSTLIYFFHERAWNFTNWGRHSRKTSKSHS
jgi:uncharacterized membrane protein